jgi:uncharacterized membrane protein
MASHETSLVVDRPVRTVYNQWTQFSTFPQFMSGVERIDQISETKTRGRAHWIRSARPKHTG